MKKVKREAEKKRKGRTEGVRPFALRPQGGVERCGRLERFISGKIKGEAAALRRPARSERKKR
ncbi:MAG: hypothetical protein MSH25_10655, partial [Desulfovibrio sp.]|uniref:hypothetical protein n=1 Tax=Desulfovibrio sp. TaxID=885 RepID=UPI0025BD98C8